MAISRWLLLTALTILLAGGTALLVRGTAKADGDVTLYVSGFDIGPKKTASLRLTNVSPSVADVYSIQLTVREIDQGIVIRRPVGDGARLFRGQTLELEIGDVVDQFRAGFELSGWDGAVQVVAFGTGGVLNDFGPDTVLVEAVQTEGKASYGVVVEWRVEE